MREQLARMERRLNQLVRGRRGTRRRAAASRRRTECRRRSTPSTSFQRVNRDVERSLLRARNGVRYVRGTHAPKVGATPKDVVWRRGKAELWRYRNAARSATARRC